MKTRIYVLLLLACMPLMMACGFYSFTGASIAPNIHSVTIKYFPNTAMKVNPALSQLLTETLKDKFTRETRLQIVDKGGDLEFSGNISDYSITAIGRNGNQAASNQLSISVKVDYVNRVNPKESWSTTITKTSTYDASQSLATVESDLCNQICKLIADEIFNRSVANW